MAPSARGVTRREVLAAGLAVVVAATPGPKPADAPRRLRRRPGGAGGIGDADAIDRMLRQ